MRNGVERVGRERVPRAELPAYEQRASTQDGRNFRVFERRERGTAPISSQDSDALVIRFAEPFESNSGAVGLNQLSIPAVREAVGRAIVSDLPAASAGFRLTQEVGDQTGVA